MRQDMMLRAYKASLAMEPIALLYDFVRVITYGQDYWGRVNFYEAIPPFQWIDFVVANGLGAAGVPAATAAAKSNVTNLDLYEDEFGQWRFFPLDNMQVQLYNPAGASKWQLKNLQVGIDKNIIYRDPTLVTTEFFSYEDQHPAMQATNFSGYALPAARIVGYGYRFHIEEPTNKMIPEMIKRQYPDMNIINLLAAGIMPSTPIQCAGYIGYTAKL